jgi:hypothetical protein
MRSDFFNKNEMNNFRLLIQPFHSTLNASVLSAVVPDTSTNFINDDEN